MGLYDRDYTQADYSPQHRYGQRMRIGMPKLTPVVKALLIANVAIFFAGITIFAKIVGVQTSQGVIPVTILEKWFAVFPHSFGWAIQIWRLITYQFLHGSPMHILYNMIGLFFLGPTLERHWGGKRFLIFYLSCGVAGAAFYILLALTGVLIAGPMVGASGAILGMLAACAILFPHFVVILLFFPVPIRFAAAILVFLYVANLLSRGYNAGGDAAHLAGMAAGAAYVFSESWRAKFLHRVKTDAWRKKTTQQRNVHEDLDRILDKVHNYGIHSLSRSEKRILKQATEAERRRNTRY